MLYLSQNDILFRGAPCPLCRTRGPFVELRLEWEPAICDEEPEVAFNPCGHIVSEAVAKKWAALALPDNAPPNARYRPICPFCAKPLKTDLRNSEHPYTKILFQSQGFSDDDDDNDSNNDDAYVFTPISFLCASQVLHHGRHHRRRRRHRKPMTLSLSPFSFFEQEKFLHYRRLFSSSPPPS